MREPIYGEGEGMKSLKDWHMHVDSFLEHDLSALCQIPDTVSNQEIHTYLKYFHGISISLQEITPMRQQYAERHVYPMK